MSKTSSVFSLSMTSSKFDRIMCELSIKLALVCAITLPLIGQGQSVPVLKPAATVEVGPTQRPLAPQRRF